MVESTPRALREAPAHAVHGSRCGSELRAAVLVATGLGKRLGGRAVISALDLTVHRGESVALLGANGAGKTTLLRLCAGALERDSGSISVAGSDPSAPRARRALGFVPQELAIYPELTGRENVALFARLCGVAGARLKAAVARALEAVGLAEPGDLRASHYSGGMCRRLSVACAIVHAPSLLLLDEPFVGLDDESRRKLFDGLLEQKRAGLALLLSTHRADEVRALCDRAVTLRDGRIDGEQQIAPDHARSTHASPPLMSFTGGMASLP